MAAARRDYLTDVARRYGFRMESPRVNSMGDPMCTCGRKKQRLEVESDSPYVWLYEYRCALCAQRVESGREDGHSVLERMLRACSA